MSRFHQLRQRLQQLRVPAVSLNQPVVIDVGAQTTRVVFEGKKLYLQPTTLAWHTPTQSVIALGNRAEEMMGRSPAQIEVLQPLSPSGYRLDVLGAYFQALGSELKQLDPKLQLLTATVQTNQPLGLSKVHNRLWHSSAQILTPRPISFLSQTEAACLALQQQRQFGREGCLMIVGHRGTEISFWSDGQLVKAGFVPIGGWHFTEMMKMKVRQTYHVEVSWQTAEWVKHQVGQVNTVGSKPDAKHAVVKGKDLVKWLPTSQRVSSDDITADFAKLAQQLVFDTQRFLSSIDPQLLTTMLDHPIMVSGGGSKLVGLASFLAESLQAEVVVSQHPESDVIRGLTLIQLQS